VPIKPTTPFSGGSGPRPYGLPVTSWRGHHRWLFAAATAALATVTAIFVADRVTRHVPHIDPADFHATVDNPFFGLEPGTRWVYRYIDHNGHTGQKTVEATFDTRRVMGVTCIAVRGTEAAGGQVAEASVDWYAQDIAGNVWYFGEQTTEPASVDGSWMAGVAGAWPGIAMKGRPRLGDRYPEEDRGIAEIRALAGRATVPVGTFAGVLVTRDTSRLEPGRAELRYYAEGVGLVLVTTDRGDRTELVEMTRTAGPSVGAGRPDWRSS
jgi:hypothetical protein